MVSGVESITSMDEAEKVFQTAQSEFLNAAQENDEDFEATLQSAVSMLKETSDLQNKADSEAIRFALGQSDNTHDLLIAQSKANVALQYTVAVKDKLVEAYREIIQMQV